VLGVSPSLLPLDALRHSAYRPAMPRFYVWTDGTPGYIAAEVAIRDVDGTDEARAWASDWCTPLPGQRIISEAEARMRPAYGAALEAWERRDDAVMQAAEVAEIHASRRIGADLGFFSEALGQG
jgi:hypothetical protein